MVDVHARLIRQPRAGRRASTARSSSCPATTRSPSARPRIRVCVAPELAVVMAYCKIHLYARAARVRPARGPLPRPRPRALLPAAAARRATREQMREHRLRREIIATVVANQLVDRAGTTFVFRLGEETGAARVAPGARLCGGARGVRDALVLGRGRGARQPGRARDQLEMLIEGRRLVERATRWLVRANPRGDRHRGHDRAVRAGRGVARRRAARRARRARPRGIRRAGRPSFTRRGRARASSPPGGGDAALLVRVRHRRGRRGHRATAAEAVMAPTSRSARGSSSPGCATGSSSCRAPTAGRRSRARRCATTSTASSAS